MARKKSSIKDIFELIEFLVVLVVTILCKLWYFMLAVNELKLWKEFVVTTSIVVILNGLLFYLITNNTLLFEDFGWICFLSLSIFICYWIIIITIKREHLQHKLWIQKSWWWSLSPYKFEQEVAKIFKLYGYKTKVTKASGDGGIDIIIKKDGNIGIVQCKHHRNPVGPEPIRALWGVKDDFNADKVFSRFIRSYESWGGFYK